MMKSLAVLTLAGLQKAWGQSLSSCGQAGDHLSNVKMSLSPDPIKRKWNTAPQAFTISVSGDLDIDVTGGSFDIDLTASAFGQGSTTTEIIDFKLSDGLIKKGTGMQIVVGPIQLPNLPFSATINGSLKITNELGESIACVKLDVKAPLLDDHEEAETKELAFEKRVRAPPAGLSICSQSTSHIKNLVIDEAEDTSVTITGTFDETIDTFDVNVALKLQVAFVPYTVNVAVPVKLTNMASPVDDFSIYVSAPKNVSKTNWGNNDLVTVTGEITATDANGEEILCLDIANTTEAIVV